MINKFIGICCFLLLPFSAYAGNQWYVDPNATGSNGTSWANAWKSPASINWGAVRPGDTIYLSGGTSSQTYTTPLVIGNSGTSGNPITIAAGQDAGHNGQVVFDAGGSATAMLNIGASQYITVNGNYNGTRNIIVQNEDMTADHNIVSGGGRADALSHGIHFTYLEVRNAGTGIRQNYSRDSEIDHVYLHNISCEAAIAVNGSLGNYSGDMSQYNLYDQGWLIHDNTIQVNNDGANNGDGPDAVQGTHGLSVYNNLIYGAKGTRYCSQHQDGVQIGGNFYKIYGNTMYCLGNSDMEGESGDLTAGFIHVYNNVFEQCATQINSHVIEIATYAATTHFTDLLIANNTFVDNTGFVAIRLLNNGAAPGAIVDNIRIHNNIMYNTPPYAIQPPFGAFCGTGIIIDSNNINGGPNGTSTEGTCNGTPYSDTNRKMGAPSFVSYSQYATGANDLHLTASSKVDSGAGIPLASLFNTDKDGALRTPPWSLGAYIFGTSAGQPAPPTNLAVTVQ